MSVLKQAIDDLFDPRLAVEEAFGRHFSAAFRQRVDGAAWTDRDGFIAGLCRKCEKQQEGNQGEHGFAKL